MFDKKGQIIIDKEECEMDPDELMMIALDAGAEDFSEEEDSYEVITAPGWFFCCPWGAGGSEYPHDEADVTMIPQTWVELTDEDSIKKWTVFWICLMRMMTFRRCTTTGMNNYANDLFPEKGLKSSF